VCENRNRVLVAVQKNSFQLWTSFEYKRNQVLFIEAQRTSFAETEYLMILNGWQS
jgi:hypothetical protein